MQNLQVTRKYRGRAQVFGSAAGYGDERTSGGFGGGGIFSGISKKQRFLRSDTLIFQILTSPGCFIDGSALDGSKVFIPRAIRQYFSKNRVRRGRNDSGGITLMHLR